MYELVHLSVFNSESEELEELVDRVFPCLTSTRELMWREGGFSSKPFSHKFYYSNSKSRVALVREKSLGIDRFPRKLANVDLILVFERLQSFSCGPESESWFLFVFEGYLGVTLTNDSTHEIIILFLEVTLRSSSSKFAPRSSGLIPALLIFDDLVFFSCQFSGIEFMLVTML